MADMEIALTTDSSGESFCVSVWSISSGMQIKTYKTGSCLAHGLSLLGSQYVLGAQMGKPILHVWNVAKEQLHMKMICPGRISAVTCSPDGNYCVAACGEKIYVWQVGTGRLHAVIARHYQRVTCLVFTDDGTHLISGGDDNMVIIWSMAELLCQSSPSLSSEQSLIPTYTWSDHALPVTDIHCSSGGSRARVFTSSLDQTCKLYSLASGDLLCSFVFDCSITAIVTDPAEYNLFAGASNGRIYQIMLYNPGFKQENHITNEGALNFTGHSKQVTSLAVTMDGTVLLSGSNDNTARVWHIQSRQSIRTLTHKGAVTNVQIIRRPVNFTDPLSRNLWPPLQPFKRHMESRSSKSNDSVQDTGVAVNLSNKIPKETLDLKTRVRTIMVDNDQKTKATAVSKRSHEDLIEDVQQLKRINQNFYQFAVEELMAEVHKSLEGT